MSAAEKLKGLQAVEAIDWPAPSHKAYRENEWALRTRDQALVDALPQIVAVLEAAETNLVTYDAALIAAGMNTTPNKMLAAALAALDSALGDVT